MISRPVDRRIKVAIFVYDYSTSGVSHSGGRYHALLLAYAMAHENIDVTVVCDQRPAFVNDLEYDYGQSVEFVYTSSFDPSVVTGAFDFVFVAPTGGFNPAFYACAEVLAGRCRATPVLINYESANWFNALAPTPDHLSVWDYWRRTVVCGGIVLSSTNESDGYARDYYRSDKRPLHFTKCYPPLNSRAAAQALAGTTGKDGALLYFARPFHDHKGGADILNLPSDLLAGRDFRVVVGGAADMRYFDRLRAKVDGCGGRLEIYSRVSERMKFALLARSSLLLFPSRFEGFGYPPLEAALVATPSVCYDLPVLRETLGEVGCFAPIGDVVALADEARRVLASPAFPERLCARADEVAGFDRISRQIARDIASWPSAPTDAGSHVVHWGPWTAQDQRRERSHLSADDPPMPAYAIITGGLDGELSITFKLLVRKPIATATVWNDAVVIPASAEHFGAGFDGWIRAVIRFRLAPRHLGRQLRLACYGANGRLLDLDTHFMVCEIHNPLSGK